PQAAPPGTAGSGQPSASGELGQPGGAQAYPTRIRIEGQADRPQGASSPASDTDRAAGGYGAGSGSESRETIDYGAESSGGCLNGTVATAAVGTAAYVTLLVVEQTLNVTIAGLKLLRDVLHDQRTSRRR